MTRRHLINAYVGAAVLLTSLCIIWFVLNQFRVRYYEDAVEGRPDSPYWPVIQAQDVLQWPIKVLFVLLFGVAIYEVIRGVSSWLRN